MSHWVETNHEHPWLVLFMLLAVDGYFWDFGLTKIFSHLFMVLFEMGLKMFCMVFGSVCGAF